MEDKLKLELEQGAFPLKKTTKDWLLMLKIVLLL